MNDAGYAKFHKSYTKFLEKHPDGVTDSDYPNCGPLFTNLKPAIEKLLLRMLHPDPSKRAAIQDIISHRWTKTIDCCSQETEEESLLSKPTKRMSGKFDAGKASLGGLKVVKQHNHLPPKQHRMPQHRFDMGDGYS